ncbi:MAG: hypothetical protein KAJ01_02245, partial [Candidatus Hydrogenedentes bacterium]|nr:hypothetical protein [Candidatus Hydrogenedentota bacterium]
GGADIPVCLLSKRAEQMRLFAKASSGKPLDFFTSLYLYLHRSVGEFFAISGRAAFTKRRVTVTNGHY